MTERKLKAGRLQALEWIFAENAKSLDGCYDFIFDAPHVRFLDKPKAPHWVGCYLVNGPPQKDQYPVKTCVTIGCVNGKHYRWGSYPESIAARKFRSRVGEKNPAAKFTELEVSQLKSVRWGNGIWKKNAAEAMGVTVMTLHEILSGRKWAHVAPYKSAAKTEGDEF